MSIEARNGCCTRLYSVILKMGGGKYSFYLETETHWSQKVYDGVSPGYIQNGKRVNKELLVAFDYHEFKTGDEVRALGRELAKEYHCEYYGHAYL